MTVLSIKHFYMIRHGETTANAGGFVSGSFDTPLTDKGRKQAKEAGIILKSLKDTPKLIVHSPLSRAKETALLLNERLNLPLRENALIAERDLGDWTGFLIKEWLERRKKGLTPPNGETSEAFEKRVISGIGNIMTFPEGPVLIVTHAGVFRAFLNHYGQKIGPTGNCHTYEFVPETTDASFPWTMRHYPLPDALC